VLCDIRSVEPGAVDQGGRKGHDSSSDSCKIAVNIGLAPRTREGTKAKSGDANEDGSVHGVGFLLRRRRPAAAAGEAGDVPTAQPAEDGA
jgi:hypothetical protein